MWGAEDCHGLPPVHYHLYQVQDVVLTPKLAWARHGMGFTCGRWSKASLLWTAS